MGNNKLESTHETFTSYSYSRRDMKLAFSLGNDDKLGRRDFLELLETAAAELKAEIEKEDSES